MITYQVFDRHTGRMLGTYATRKAASRRANRLDLAYGAIRYSVRSITDGVACKP